MKQFLLDSSKNNTNVNVESSEYISLSTKQRSLPIEQVQGMINHYELYLKERNECKNYKMFFTLHPYMTNVLFNAFTEIVYNEGSIQSGIIGSGGTLANSHKNFFPTKSSFGNKVTYDALIGENYDGDRRYQLLRDTELSHKEMGNVTYHCGLDIFNNHYLRSKGFFCMTKGSVSINNETYDNNNTFNTLEDYLVYGSNSRIATHVREIPGTVSEVLAKSKNNTSDLYKSSTGQSGDVCKTMERPTHLFNNENIKDISTAFSEGIKDVNGWIGFYNRAYLPVKNVNGKTVTVNKCLNNHNACDFIDMYPDRSLFSFIPKINVNYNSREEYNWKWFLTYPFENITKKTETEEFDFFSPDKGLKILWNSNNHFYKNNVDLLPSNSIMRDSRLVYFRTKAKHNLSIGDSVKLSYTNGSFVATIISLGDEKLENKQYYFVVSYDDLADEFGENSVMVDGVSIFYVQLPINFYMAKLVDGVECKYYIRAFKKLNEITSTLNKMAFSRTIYNDNIVQIMYDENVSVDGLKDNLGREVSEVFLTLVKTNKGNENYYISGNTSPLHNEYSHCFGQISSGFNFEVSRDEFGKISPTDSNITNYNVRNLYNLINFTNTEKNSLRLAMGINYPEPQNLEGFINEENEIFYGDFVEFSPNRVEETVLEDVYHRFNTAQRETKLTNETFNFKNFKYDKIRYDDFDFDFTEFDGENTIGATAEAIPNFEVITVEGFHNDDENEVTVVSDMTNVYDNLFPEGYFYKPHYKVKLKEYSNIVSFGYDVIIAYGERGMIKRNSESYMRYEFQTAGNIPYAFNSEDKIVILYTDNTYKEYYVDAASRGSTVVFFDTQYVEKNIKYIFYKNPDIPTHAIYLGDGTGKYVWRDLINDTELTQESDIYNRTYANGAVYVNTNINFYLRRQDPYGIYGLKRVDNGGDASSNGGIVGDFIVNGVAVELPDIDYKTEENYTVCEN